MRRHVIVLLAASAVACSRQPIETAGGEVMTRGGVLASISAWPAKSQEAARFMIDKYGQPNEQTATTLVWYAKGPWKRTILYRDEVPHSFPKQHTDLLEQFIDYRVPVDKYDDLAAYDGSVIIERTKGELSARCDKEEANFLALNLANDIATGRKSVEEARLEYAQTIQHLMAGKKSPYVERLQFAAQASAADKDKPAMTQPKAD